MRVTREERGWPGHFIGAAQCNFRRNTLLTCGEIRVVVSTVGAYRPYQTERFEEIGYDRYYETMAFMAEFVEPVYWDADVTRRVDFAATWQINAINKISDAAANQMHEDVVAELTQCLEQGDLHVSDE